NNTMENHAMKNFFLALALAAVPAAAQADDLDQFGAAETAQRLIRNLNDLSVVARRQASTVRNPQLSNHLFQLERLSNTVAGSVRQDVLRFLDRRNNPRRA